MPLMKTVQILEKRGRCPKCRNSFCLFRCKYIDAYAGCKKTTRCNDCTELKKDGLLTRKIFIYLRRTCICPTRRGPQSFTRAQLSWRRINTASAEPAQTVSKSANSVAGNVPVLLGEWQVFWNNCIFSGWMTLMDRLQGTSVPDLQGNEEISWSFRRFIFVHRMLVDIDVSK